MISWGHDEWRSFIFAAVAWAALSSLGYQLMSASATPAGPATRMGYALSVVIVWLGALITGSLMDGPFPRRPFLVRFACFVLSGVLPRASFIGAALLAGVSSPFPGGPVLGGLQVLLIGTTIPTADTWREVALLLVWAFAMPAAGDCARRLVVSLSRGESGHDGFMAGSVEQVQQLTHVYAHPRALVRSPYAPRSTDGGSSGGTADRSMYADACHQRCESSVGGVPMDSQALRDTSEDLYRSGQLLCSEAIVYAFNEALGRPFPKEVVKLASAFPVGMGSLGTGGCSCGALSGGMMVLGMVHGRCEPGSQAPDVLAKAKELHDWFADEKGSTCCRVLIRDFDFGSPDHMDQCVAFTGDVAERVALMLTE